MLFRNERIGKKLSNEEIYILSQKNLVTTLDGINEKTKNSHFEENNHNDKTSIHPNEELKIDQQAKNEDIKKPEINQTQEKVQKQAEKLPLWGLKRTAFMMSKLFGAQEIKEKLNRKFDHTYSGLEKFLMTKEEKPKPLYNEKAIRKFK